MRRLKLNLKKSSALFALKSLTGYVDRLMEEDSTQVIAQLESIAVEDNVFDQFMATCEQTQAPNKALLEAAAFTKALKTPA